MTHRINKTLTTFLLLATMAFFAGCGTVAESEDVAEQRSNLRALAAAYGSYVKNNRGRVPKNEKSFRKWIEKQGSVEDFGAQSLDEMFISSRDDEPYVVVYGKPKKVVAYEAVGIDGSRYIADDLGIVQEVDEATFRDMVPDAK